MTDKSHYLGDGVYAELEHGMICLTADREDGGVHRIYLEVEVFQNLLEYAKQFGWVK